MASTYSTNLALELIGTGDQSGTWGTTTNTNLGTLIEQSISGVVTQAITDGASANTTITIPNGATGVARNMFIEMTGALTVSSTSLIVPTNKKLYFIYNNTTGGFAVTVKVSGQTGISVPNGAKIVLVMNSAGTDVVVATNYMASLTLGSALPVASGGTGATSNAGTAFALKGANADITSLTGLTTALGVPYGGTGAVTLTGLVKGSGTAALAAATAGTDYVAPGTATTFTALQTFNGTSALGALKTININEPATISATASTGTINFDVTTQSVLYYTTNATGNFTLNFRASSGTSLNTLLATGDSICVSFLCTNGATAYYNSLVQVDGSTVTPKYQGGTAWTSGNASSIDAYNFVIVKTGSAAFTILTSQTKFA